MWLQELENALAMEKLDLQEQQSDRQELEETLVKLEKHKDKLIQQIKSIRQLCYNESQQVLIRSQASRSFYICTDLINAGFQFVEKNILYPFK